MIQNPRKNLDRHQNLTDSSLGHAAPLHKISSKSVHENDNMASGKRDECEGGLFLTFHSG